MAIFGNSETIVSVQLEDVRVSPQLAARLPDPGSFLLDLISFLDQAAHRATETAIAGLRHHNGAIPGQSLRSIGIRDWKSGPLTHLAWLTAKDCVIIETWASLGLGRRNGRLIGQGAKQVYLTQGVPTAATWALRSRPDAQLDVDFLATQLANSWLESGAHISNGDVVKSFKKWRTQGDLS